MPIRALFSIQVIIREWYVKVGDTVNQFDKICEVQSDKASVTITSRFDGKITKLCYEVEDTARVGEALVELEIDSGSSASIDKVDDQDLSFQNSSSAAEKAKSEEFKSLNPFGKVLTTPSVRKLAAENNINLSNVKPTGKDGRVLKEDVMLYLNFIESSKSGKPPETRPPAAAVQQPAKPMPQHVLEHVQQYQPAQSSDRIVPIKGIQKAMYKTMTNSLNIPHFGLSDEIDLTKLVQLREELKSLKDEQLKITYMPFFVKAASLALSRYPILNSSIDETGQNLIYKSQHNIGIAIDTVHGLIVANIKSVNQRSITDIASEMIRLQELAANNQLSNEDLSGATFTLSNIGSVGGLFGIPVIAQPQVSIGAIGKLRKVPKFDEKDNIVKSFQTIVVWTADHRVIDGATMCRFNNLFKLYVENPATMLTSLR